MNVIREGVDPADTATIAEVRAYIEREYPDPASQVRIDALRQLDALQERGVHRIERYVHSQSAHVSVGDAYSRMLSAERAEQRQEFLDRANAPKETPAQGGERIGDIDTGNIVQPEPSTGTWARAYDVSKEKDGSIAYRREGVVQIRDDGRTLAVASDERAIRDALALAKERGLTKIGVTAIDPEKRAAIMREAVRQNVAVETHRDPTVENEYHKAMVAVEKERAQERVRSRGERAQVRDEPERGM